jgi:hypothetical protein
MLSTLKITAGQIAAGEIPLPALPQIPLLIQQLMQAQEFSLASGVLAQAGKIHVDPAPERLRASMLAARSPAQAAWPDADSDDMLLWLV